MPNTIDQITRTEAPNPKSSTIPNYFNVDTFLEDLLKKQDTGNDTPNTDEDNGDDGRDKQPYTILVADFAGNYYSFDVAGESKDYTLRAALAMHIVLEDPMKIDDDERNNFTKIQKKLSSEIGDIQLHYFPAFFESTDKYKRFIENKFDIQPGYEIKGYISGLAYLRLSKLPLDRTIEDLAIEYELVDKQKIRLIPIYLIQNPDFTRLQIGQTIIER